MVFYVCNYDVITKARMISLKKSFIQHRERLTCAEFRFFLWERFRRKRSNVTPFIPTWLPHHVTYDLIIIISTFYMSICTYGENSCQSDKRFQRKGNNKMQIRTYTHTYACTGHSLTNYNSKCQYYTPLQIDM